MNQLKSLILTFLTIVTTILIVSGTLFTLTEFAGVSFNPTFIDTVTVSTAALYLSLTSSNEDESGLGVFDRAIARLFEAVMFLVPYAAIVGAVALIKAYS